MKRQYTRLTKPLVRDAGVLRTAGWDEALDRAAAGFSATTAQYSPRSFGLFLCSSAAWANTWLGLDVGSDIALANAMGRETIAAGLCNHAFIERATTGFEAYRVGVEAYTLEFAERITGVAGDTIRELAHAYARADRAQVCWTLGITEHHNAADHVF